MSNIPRVTPGRFNPTCRLQKSARLVYTLGAGQAAKDLFLQPIQLLSQAVINVQYCMSETS